MLPSVGSSEDGSIPVGPIDPATKTGRAKPAAAWRASVTAARLISSVRSPRPYSSSLRRLDWNVLVSSTSTPASR
jgi:hypothetical protein